ncbi:mitochondrial-processing peptidase subunit beta [Culex quinquefasciatus]|uniref:Mitochondrial-processing peptidase subunit beta n=1 Tax=Culex quinquefasciatus TaxID=7176 RepID=B0X4S5_CULQU|nr:mitochondrial-processing peptidase subunit beta [Culex quinquefasciatus]|eukprot:XP_001864647.1 mitochondrial-processing peptidase subunit beta [Culex quinquefasciatus]
MVGNTFDGRTSANSLDRKCTSGMIRYSWRTSLVPSRLRLDRPGQCYADDSQHANQLVGSLIGWWRQQRIKARRGKPVPQLPVVQQGQDRTGQGHRGIFFMYDPL